MGIVVGWFILSVIIGYMGQQRKIGFVGALLCSLVLSPIIGGIITLASKRLDTESYEQEMLDMQRRNTYGENYQSETLAREVEKLSRMKDNGEITWAEYEIRKQDLIRKLK